MTRALWLAAVAVALLPRPGALARRVVGAVATLRQRRAIRQRHRRPRPYLPVELRAAGWRWVERR